jgi:hypothetical protein
MEGEIKKITENYQNITSQAFNEFKIITDNIINSQITDVKQIELTLNYMLDFCYDERMLQLYKELCRYYWDINPQATADYINYYREMWDSDDV